MRKFQLSQIFTRFAIPGLVVGVMAIGALLPATASAASVQSAKCGTGDGTCVIAVGDKLIADRLKALGTLNTKITDDQSAKKITNDQANALEADVSTNESGLNSLKTKLDAETTAKAARVDVVNIYKQFRIYAVVLPRDSRHLLLDTEINAKDIFVASEPAIQAAITAAPASQQAKLKDLYSDYQKQVSDSEAQIDTATQDIPQMTPSAFNLTHSAYETVRQSLDNATKTASKDLHKAANDLHQMVTIIGHDI